MASWSEQNYSCPVCHEIYQDPVLLSCSHNFCKACLQRWWTEKPSYECPLCRRRSSQSDPPRNLGLKNQCEAFLKERAEACSLQSQLEARTNHSFRSISEAGRDYSDDGHQELLKPLQEKLELFNDYKGNFEQTAVHIEAQAQDTERQIEDVFSMLKRFLKKEKQARIAALREEKKQKQEMIRRKIEGLSRDIAALSDTIRATEDVLRAEDVSLQQRFGVAAEIAHFSPPSDPEPIAGAVIDMDKHLNNLAVNVLDKMKEKVTSSSRNPRTSDPQTTAVSLGEFLSRLNVRERQSSVERPETSRYFTAPHHRVPSPPSASAHDPNSLTNRVNPFRRFMFRPSDFNHDW